MILIGRYFSPFVRRVGATLQHYGFGYEHRAIKAAGVEQDEIRKSNPLGRVPTLILDNGQVLSDSALILDYLDTHAGAEKSLMPLAGEHRLRLHNLLSIATGAAEKAIAVFSENIRPPDKRHPPYTDNCTRQAKDGFEFLDKQAAGPWFDGGKLTQLDISIGAYLDFMQVGVSDVWNQLNCPNLTAITARALELPAFKATQFEV